MALPARYFPHYTVEDYELWDGDWELWDGTAVAMSPSPKKVHQRISKRLTALLDEALSKADCADCEVLQEVDWRVSHDTVFRPDVFISCSDPDSDYVSQPPRFIAEILSDSTREKDQHFKRRAYESLGVEYYLIVDPKSSELCLLRLLGGVYSEMDVEQPCSLQIDTDCEVSVDLTRLLGEASE